MNNEYVKYLANAPSTSEEYTIECDAIMAEMEIAKLQSTYFKLFNTYKELEKNGKNLQDTLNETNYTRYEGYEIERVIQSSIYERSYLSYKFDRKYKDIFRIAEKKDITIMLNVNKDENEFVIAAYEDKLNESGGKVKILLCKVNLFAISELEVSPHCETNLLIAFIELVESIKNNINNHVELTIEELNFQKQGDNESE